MGGGDDTHLSQGRGHVSCRNLWPSMPFITSLALVLCTSLPARQIAARYRTQDGSRFTTRLDITASNQSGETEVASWRFPCMTAVSSPEIAWSSPSAPRYCLNSSRVIDLAPPTSETFISASSMETIHTKI